MAEIQVHGSKAVIDALHTSISNIENCRLAEPGEFTKLAFQNGKINLLKAESVADLISSETEIQRQQAIKIMNGKSADQFNLLREKLLKILSHVEAKIDFLQIRRKAITLDQIYSLASKIVKFTKNHSCKLIINDHLEIAKDLNADGVHLGIEDYENFLKKPDEPKKVFSSYFREKLHRAFLTKII